MSLSEPLEQLAVLLNDLLYARFEFGISESALNRLAQRELDCLVEALSLSASERLSIGGELVVQAESEAL